MKLQKIIVATAIALGFTASAQANDFPVKPIKIIVPWAPGGATDVIARVLGQRLSESVGQPVVIENKAGAGGNIGTGAFVQEASDGHSLLMGTSSTNAINPSLYKTLPFNPKADFSPIILVATVPNVLVVPTNSKFKSVDELVAFAKANPGKLTVGSAGNGSSQHIAGAMLLKSAGISLTHVPYKGSGPAAADLMAGHIDLMLDTGSMNHIKGGKLKALAIASNKRIDGLPEVPTFEELGYKDMNAAAWYALYASSKTPDAQAQKLNAELNKILKQPEVKQRLTDFGAIVNGGSTKELGDFTVSETARYKVLINEAKIAIE
ncbi:Bug family tripartite tricarboxylate transporter substrate binding protein [Comamonas aquatica]|uniref:Tripartite tricarboxylate transporter substrate binding protein n=4 Tax=Comamonas aquatica TaxID=225991 RepID=A0AA42HVY6_9BURK|nr:tripartite tricarboxylate transporter substrate binding protein [Comamonas aquatica]MDH0365279.1 tripartite tricarboxylate transporter substrate binding protein [Comamonas aquatica]MDH0373660.1 tripartite tricarboxylate transporter substrate binding protein [Comamonas aquatica]MDH0383697.1 tripartite tricarboxylate transporter substrate binding protein [Comamonas aquatica]MDH0431663.1 tripartite tricarboxylate transporter substrate binding protein [Comamonas aquatica]MDH0942786.1 tripartite